MPFDTTKEGTMSTRSMLVFKDGSFAEFVDGMNKILGELSAEARANAVVNIVPFYDGKDGHTWIGARYVRVDEIVS